MSDSIDTRVTPSFCPETIQAIPEYDDETASILAGTEAAFKEAFIGVARVHDASAASKRNPAWNENAALIETQNFADKMFTSIAKRFDSATANLTRVAEALESELSQPLEGRGVGGMAAEIRSYVKALPEGQRLSFVQRAIEAGDERTVGAVLGGPAYLTDMMPEMHAALLKVYHEKAEPRKAKQLRAARAGLKILGERAPLLFAQMEKAVGAPQQKVQQLRAAKAAAEKSFVV